MNSYQKSDALTSHCSDEKISDSSMQSQNKHLENRSLTTSTMSLAENITNPHVFKGSWHFLATFGCLSLINLMCAIDATILSVALPVCHVPECAKLSSLLSCDHPDNGYKAPRICYPSVLVRLLEINFNPY